MIRFATEADLPAILDIYGPYVLNTAISFEYSVPSPEEFTERFRSITAQFPWLVWEEDGAVLGYAYGSLPFSRDAYRWCAASSIYLAPRAQGRGIGKKLYAALESLLKAQGYHKTYAIVTSANDGSLAFHKAVGFQEVATMPACGYKFGQLYGITWLEKILSFPVVYDHFPPPIREVVNVYRFFQ
jgi:phosphinothricin acetyltransferase